MKRILITGSRTWDKEDELRDAIDSWIRRNVEKDQVSILVHGDASRGADRMGRDYARLAWWLQEEAHPADWESNGRAAGFIRNQEMVDLGADVCLAFIKDGSKGATHTAGQAAKAGIPVWRYLDNEGKLSVES